MTVMLDAACIDAQIKALVDDWEASEHLRDDARQARDRAHAAEEAADAIITNCTERIDADCAEICRLRQERDLIPTQGPPA